MDDNIFNRLIGGALFTMLTLFVVGFIAYVVSEYRDANREDKRSMIHIGLGIISFAIVSAIVGYLIPGNWL